METYDIAIPSNNGINIFKLLLNFILLIQIDTPHDTTNKPNDTSANMPEEKSCLKKLTIAKHTNPTSNIQNGIFLKVFRFFKDFLL